MEIKQDYDFGDLQENCWSGAIDTLNTIEEHDMEEDLMNLLEEIFLGIPTITEVNDFLRFKDDFIFDTLGINEEEEEEEEEGEEGETKFLNFEDILNGIKDLSQSQGSYGRLYNDLIENKDTMEEFKQEVMKQKFTNFVDFIMWLEG